MLQQSMTLWIAHYGYHLATSYDAAWPVLQRFAMDLGITGLGEPEWARACCTPTGAWLLCVELLGVYKNIALWLHKKYNYKTVFAHKHII